MKIFGIGTDIINTNRIKKSLNKKNTNFKRKIFSKKEILYCENKKDSFKYFAKRFAAKEAFSKALGTGIRKGIDFKNIEIFNDKLGKPSITLKGTTESYLKKKIKAHKYFIYLSLSDDYPWAQATVVISYN